MFPQKSHLRGPSQDTKDVMLQKGKAPSVFAANALSLIGQHMSGPG